MERKAFQLLHDAEASWWYRARATVVERVLAHYSHGPQTILDLGAGFGGMAPTLLPHGIVDAFDVEKQQEATHRGYRSVLDISDHEALPNDAYSLIAIFDVLEHTPDDATFLAKLHQVLTKNGALIITVPAFQFLWSEHDVLHHHFRRYSKRSLHKVLSAQGFEVSFMSYWNMLLFFPAALVRLLGRSGESSLLPTSPLNALFRMIVTTESKLIPHCSLPFGTGLVCYAIKK
jgi:SAM-dependent methyltransferase